MTCAVIPAATLALPATPLDTDQIVSGDPRVAALDVLATSDLTVGVWEHTAGVSTDVETDEVFVVLAGRATVAVEGGPTLQLGPGDIGVLEAESRTTWTVHETLRKVYVVARPAPSM
jgi:uncharacterized protein